MIPVILQRKYVVCVLFLVSLSCTYFLYSKVKKDMRKDFTGDNAGESRNNDIQITAGNLRKYMKEHFERDISTMKDIKDFTGDKAGESRNTDIQNTAGNLRNYMKEHFERDIATTEDIKDFTGDFTGDKAGESRNTDLQNTEGNLRNYMKEHFERDNSTMKDIKEGDDGCLVSELDDGNSDNYTKAERRAKSLFFERISQKDKTEFRDLIQTFSKVASSNITYFLCAGSLYGSYFYHGMVPWDDDVDIIVKDKDKPSLLKSVRTLGPEYELYAELKDSWKLYHTQSPQAGEEQWNWPFLDIFFYSERDSYIQTGRKLKTKFNKSDIFPLITRPFMGMMLPAPRETRKVLDLHYNFDLHVCVSNSYDHRLEKPVPMKCRSKLPCSLLKDKFPFVTSE